MLVDSPVAASALIVLAFVVGLAVPQRRGPMLRVGWGILLAAASAFVLSDAATTALFPQNTSWPFLLSGLIAVPAVGALVVAFLPRQSPETLRRATLLALGLNFALSLRLLSENMSRGWHFQHVVDWVPSLGIRYHVAVDGLSVWMILLGTVTAPIAARSLFSAAQSRHKELAVGALLLQAASIGCLVSLDLALFAMFWVALALPFALVLGLFGAEDRRYAAARFLVTVLASSSLMIAAIGYLAAQHLQLAGYWSFDYLALSRVMLGYGPAWLCFIAFVIAFFSRSALFPFHSWLSSSALQAPPGLMMLLSGSFLPLGVYGYARFCLGLFGGPAGTAAAPLASALILLCVVYAALLRSKDQDLRSIVGYLALGQLGLAVLGLCTVNESGMAGMVLQLLSFGCASAALFFLLGVLERKRGSLKLADLGGLARSMPVLSALFFLASFAVIGVPGGSGFIADVMILLGMMMSSTLGNFSHLQAILMALALVVAASAAWRVLQTAFWGPLDQDANAALQDIAPADVLSVAPLLVLTIALGFFPGPVVDSVRPTMDSIITRLNDQRAEFVSQEGGAATRLLDKRGGPLDRGYPEDPRPAEAQSLSKAMPSAAAEVQAPQAQDAFQENNDQDAAVPAQNPAEQQPLEGTP